MSEQQRPSSVPAAEIPTSGESGGLPPPPWLTSGVISIGAASLCSDTGHEMVTSVLPAFLTSTLHAGPAALGAIDGVADALTGLAKLAGGPLADDPARRGRVASGGYLATATATAAIGLTGALWQVAALRCLAWVARGLRSPARDMVLTSLADPRAYGRAFGVERAGDNAGAIIGPLAAAALVGTIGIRPTILISIVPGVLAAVAVTVAVRRARSISTDSAVRHRLRLNLHALRQAGIVRMLTPVALFEFGNLAATLLILRATELLHTEDRSLTAATALAIVLYAAHNGAACVASIAAGYLTDRTGPALVLGIAAGAYTVAYLMLALGPRPWPALLAAFLVAGAGIGLAETAESSLIARELPDSIRGSGFGVLGLTQSVGDLGATVVAGVLWSTAGPAVAFGYAMAWMLASLISLRILRHPAGTASGTTVSGPTPSGGTW